jgi:hypothetical protein
VSAEPCAATCSGALQNNCVKRVLALSCLSVCPSACMRAHRADSYQISYVESFNEFYRHFAILIKVENITGTLHEDPRNCRNGLITGTDCSLRGTC